MVFFALIPALVGIVVFTIINGILTKRRNAQKAKALNCQLPKQQANRLPLGIDHIQAFLAAMKNENFPNLAVEMFSDLGTTFEASILGGTGVFTVDEQNIQAILATQFSDFDVGESRRRNANPFVGSGVFTQDGKAWEHSRAMLRPQFAREQVSDLELEEKHVQNLFRVLPVPRSSDGWTEELDIQPLFFNLTLDAAADFLLGESTNSQLSSLTSATNQSEQNREVEEFARAFDISTLGIATRYAFGPFSGLVFPPGWRAANATCHRFVDGIVSRHLSRTQYQDIKPSSPPSSASTPSKRTPYVFLHALATSTRDPLELRSQLLHILIAGRDTTAVLLGWVFFSLSRNPSIYSKLRRRILEDFGTFENCVPESDITFKKIKACEYLQWVLNESLRMYPPVPWNSRVAGRDTTLPVGGGGEGGLGEKGGNGNGRIFVPKGRVVNYSVFVLQRRTDLWGRMRIFFARNAGRGGRWFNSGPRICLGQQYAMTEAGYVVIRLLQRFDQMQNVDEMLEPRYKMGTTNVSGRGVRVRLHVAAA